jgi:hypothetical protein
VPELMPFRLTRQLAGALAPHQATAVLQQPMAAAMGALRDGAAILQVPTLESPSGHKIVQSVTLGCSDSRALVAHHTQASDKLHCDASITLASVRAAADGLCPP